MMRLIKNNVISGIPLLHREAGEVGGAFFFKTRSSEGVRAVLRAKRTHLSRCTLFKFFWATQTRRTPSDLRYALATSPAKAVEESALL